MVKERILQSIFILPFLLALVVFNETSGASLQYGDKCVMGENSTTDLMCNAKESLSCQDGMCLCSDMTSMAYDPAIGLCVGKAGHACVNHPTESHLPNFRQTNCVAYASCSTYENENRTCECWSAFYLDETGHCLRKRSYLQQCRQDHECDGRKGFICKDGLCACDPNDAAYNPELERCVGLGNKPCINQYRECVDNYKCKLGVCSCKYKEVQGADGKMICESLAHNYGKNCGRHRGTCGPHLLCINGKCRCPNPDYQVYDYEQRICVSLVGGPCTVLTPPSSTLILEDASSLDDGGRSSKISKVFLAGSGKKGSKTKNKKKIPTLFSNATDEELSGGLKSMPCIPYARCLPYGESQSVDGLPELGRCECQRGYIETKKGKCNLPYGAPCDTHSKNKKDICDESVPLYCIGNGVNNVCGCKNALDVFDEETKSCKKSIGSLCWKEPSCVASSRCVRYSPRLPGRCMCPPNSHPDPNSSTCVLAYDVDSSLGYEEEEEEDDVSK